MAIVTVLMVAVLGVVIYFTAANMQMQSISMMRTIADSPFQLGSPGNPSDEVRLPFFMVQISPRGDMLTASSGYFDLSDQDTVQQIVNEALQAESETGRLRSISCDISKPARPPA